MANKEKENSDFEKALFIALSKHGMLLPTNTEQVKDFEEINGTTPPPSNFTPDMIVEAPKTVDNTRSLQPQIMRLLKKAKL